MNVEFIRKVLLIILLFCTAFLKAQLREFTIAEMPRPEVAVVQANAQFPDDALVLVYAAVEGLEFRSSLGAIDKQSYNASASRYELLLKPVKQMLFAAKAGFIEAKITTLNPNPKDVYYFRVEEKKEALPVSIEPGTLHISSEPSGADIYLNGFKVADKTPKEFELTGNTRIRLEKKDYSDYDTVVYVTEKSTTALNINLKTTKIGYSSVIGCPSPMDQVTFGYALNQINDQKFEENKFKIAQQVLSNSCMTVTQVNQIMGLFVFEDTKLNFAKFAYGNTYDLSNYFMVNKNFTFTSSVDELNAFINSTDDKTELSSQSGLEVKIGNQIWMLANLNTERFSNGDIIPHAQSAGEWKRAGENKQPAWCYYDNDSKNGESYGKLYNWYAVADARGLCPSAWHVPSYGEWAVLTDHLGGPEKAGKKMKSTSSWKENGNGTNEIGFSGFPGGSRDYSDGEFFSVGYVGNWWGSTENGIFSAGSRSLNYGSGSAFWNSRNKQCGFSVRCLKD